MTTEELNTIVEAVVAELEKNGVDFDNEVKEAQDTDLVFVIRETDSGYGGFKVTWKGLLDIITAQATQAKNDAETAKNAANAILSQVTTMENNVTTMESNVSTMKTSVETTKSQVEGMKNAVETTKGQVETMKTSVETSKSQVEADKGQVETMKTSIETTKSEVETLKGQAETAQQGAEGAMDTAVAAKNSVSTMKTSVEQIVSDFNTLAAEKKAEVESVYQTDLNELKGDIGDVEDRINPIDFRQKSNGKVILDVDITGTMEAFIDGIEQEPNEAIALTLEPDVPTAESHNFGVRGQICIDGNYLYVCVADNTWKKISLLNL